MGFDDVPTVAEWFWNFRDIAVFDRNLPVPVNLEAVRESWRTALEYADPPRALWYVAEETDGDGKAAAVGIGGLQSINYVHGDGILPLFIAEPARGRGLALALSVVLADMAFETLRLNRLTTYYRDDHAATQRIVERMGFATEGRTRQGWFADGVHRDIVQVGLLRSEWLDRRDTLKAELETSGALSITLERLAPEP